VDYTADVVTPTHLQGEAAVTRLASAASLADVRIILPESLVLHNLQLRVQSGIVKIKM